MRLNLSNRSIGKDLNNRTPLIDVKSTAAFLTLLAVFAYSVLPFGYIPVTSAAMLRQLPFSARLKSAATGENVSDGTYPVTFKIYTVEEGGSAVWTEVQSVNVVDGIISVNLGSVTAIPTSLDFNGDSYYLGIKIDADPELSPRKRIAAVPAALNAATVDGASVGTGANNVLKLDSSGNIDIQGGATLGGSLNVSGGLTIGSTLNVGGSVVPTSGSQYNLGSSTNKFATIYADTISAGSTTINGTNSTTFTINTEQATNNTDDASIRFYLGPTLNTYAGLQWSGTNNRFELLSRTGSSTVADLKVGNLISGSATLTLPTSTDTLVGRATTDTLTNKTLTSPVVNTPTITNPAINGTVTTTGLTLPAITVSGNITGSGSPTISGFGTINGATLSGGTLSGGTVSGGSLSATAVNGLSVSGGTITDPTVSGTVTGSGSPVITGFGTINGATISGGTLTSGTVNGVSISGGTITNPTIASATFSGTLTGSSSPIITGFGTINGATLSGGTLSGGTFSGGSVSGGTITGGSLSGIALSGTGSFTLTGGTGSGETLTLISTSHGTKGDIQFFSSANTISSAGNLTLGTNKFTVAGATGNTAIAGSLAINTDKFTVAAATGNTLIAGTLGVTGDSSFSTLSTSGLATLNSLTVTNAASVGSTLGVTGAATLSSDLTVNGNTSIGNAITDTIGITARLNSHFIPLTDATYDLGSASKRFGNFYAANAVFDSLTTPNTTANAFVINSDNATADAEDSTLEFERGSTTPNAIIGWNYASQLLYANLDFQMQGNTTLGDSSADTVTVRGATTLYDSSSTYKLFFGSATDTALYRDSANTLAVDADFLHIMTATATSGATTRDSRKSTYQGAYWNGSASTAVTGGIFLDVVDTTPTYGLALQVAGSTAVFVKNGGNVGVGTTDPQGKLHVSGGDLLVGSGTFNNASGSDDAYVTGNFEVDGTIYGSFSGGLNPGLTTGSVLFQGASGITQDNTNFFWDDSNNRLGIGTASPSRKLSVVSSGNAPAAVFNAQGNTSNEIMDIHSQYYGPFIATEQTSTTYYALDVASGATSNTPGTGNSIFRVRADGAVRVGPTFNSSLMSVYSTTNQKGLVVSARGNSSFESLDVHSEYYGPIISTEQSSSSYYVLDITNAATANTPGTGTSILRVRADGAVGISDSTPDYLLDVAGTLGVDGATILSSTLAVSGNITLGDASGDSVTSNAAAWTFANDTTVALSGGVDGLNFDSNTLSIDATNNRIGIGTAAPSANLHTLATSEQLRVGYDASNYYSTTVSSTGGVTYNAVGSGSIFVFSDTVAIPGESSHSGSLRLGASTTAGNINATALGASAAAGGNGAGGLAVGASASANSVASVAVGTSASVGPNAHNGVAIGGSAATAGAANVAIGYGTITSGDYAIAIGGSATTSTHASSIAIGNSATATAANQLVVGSGTASITTGYFGNGVTNASPASFSLFATGGSGSNIAGGSLTFQSGIATGNAAAGDIIFKGSTAGSSGSTAQTASTIMTIKGGSSSVGIGDTTPDYLLDVAGTLGVDGALTGTTSNFTSTAGTQLVVGYDSTNKNTISVTNNLGVTTWTLAGNAPTFAMSGASSYTFGSVSSSFNTNGSLVHTHGGAGGVTGFANGSNSRGQFQMGSAGDTDEFVIYNPSAWVLGTTISSSVAIQTNSSTVATFTTAGQLQVSTTGSSAGILLGGDAQLYRSAADTLRTPDSLVVDGSLRLDWGSNDAEKFSIYFSDTFNMGLKRGGRDMQIYTNTSGGDGHIYLKPANTTAVAILDGGNVGIGTDTPSSLLHLAGNRSSTSWTTAGEQLQAAAATYTDTSGSGTIASRVAASFGTPTFASSSSVTVTDAATLYIAANPTAGTNTTITTGYALWVDSGDVRFDGQVKIPTTGSSAGILIGGDTQIYRSGSDALTTPDSLTVSGSLFTNTVNGGSSAMDITTTSVLRLTGGASPGISLQSSTRATSSFEVGNYSQSSYQTTTLGGAVDIHTTSQVPLALFYHTDANAKFRIVGGSAGSDWTLEWGAGGASATDTNLFRSAADTLKTSDTFIAAAGLQGGSSSQFTVNSSGAITAVASITTTGGYTQSGTSANTFTGASTFSASGTALSVTNNATIGGTLTVTAIASSSNANISVTPNGTGDITLNTDSDTDLIIGDGGTSNYAKFDQNGALTFAGSGRPYSELFLTPNEAIVPGSNGCTASSVTAGAGSPAISYKTNDCDASTDESVFYEFKMPQNYANGSNIQVDVYWMANATSGAAIFDVGYAGIANGENYDGASITNVSGSAVTTNGTAKYINTSTVTLTSPSISADDIVSLRILRDADNGSDGLAVDAQIVKVRVKYLVGN